MYNLNSVCVIFSFYNLLSTLPPTLYYYYIYPDTFVSRLCILCLALTLVHKSTRRIGKEQNHFEPVGLGPVVKV